MIPKAIPLRNEQMFRLAMSHRSAADDPISESYERLEFFGDSVLGLVIAQYLYEHHFGWDQGMLSEAKSSVVQEGPLAETALKLGLDRFVELSPSEESTGGRTRPSILADVFEALVVSGVAAVEDSAFAGFDEIGIEAAMAIIKRSRAPVIHFAGGEFQ